MKYTSLIPTVLVSTSGDPAYSLLLLSTHGFSSALKTQTSRRTTPPPSRLATRPLGNILPASSSCPTFGQPAPPPGLGLRRPSSSFAAMRHSGNASPLLPPSCQRRQPAGWPTSSPHPATTVTTTSGQLSWWLTSSLYEEGRRIWCRREGIES